MKNKLNSKSVFFTLRVSAAVGFCLVAIAAMLLAMATIDPAHGDSATGLDKSDVHGGDGGACSWSAGPNMPSVGVRSVGVYFPSEF